MPKELHFGRAAARERLSEYSETPIPRLLHQVKELLDGDDPGRGARLLRDLLGLQDTEESSWTVGCFPQRPAGEWGDLNYALFPLPSLIELARCHGEEFPRELADRLDRAIRLGTLGAERRWDEEIFDLHRDNKQYTNVFLSYVQCLLLAGQYLGKDRLRRVGENQWRRWFHHIATYGIDEFVSDYYDVDYRALESILRHSSDERVGREARFALDHLCAVAHATTHPVLKLPVCGSSRSYRRWLEPGAREPRCVRTKSESYRPPPEVVRAYDARSFPYMAWGRATQVPFVYRSWQLPHAALGSMTGGHYFPQQLSCMAAVGRGPAQRDVIFLPGSYSCLNGYVAQDEGRALCLFARRPNRYLRYQRDVPDQELAGSFGELGIAFSDGWTIKQQGRGRLVASAWDHVVTMDPFHLVGETVDSVQLTPKRRQTLGQGRFHDTPCENMLEYVFPGMAEWAGCLVQLGQEGETLELPEISLFRQSNRLRIEEAGGLNLELHSLPHGELLQIHEEDWRTVPLLECPEKTLYPGELVVRSLNCQGTGKSK